MADIDAPLAWRMQQDGYLMQINQLRDENAKLRELMYERAHVYAIQNMTEDELRITATNVMEDNDKLRELVKSIYINYAADGVAPLGMIWEYASRLRELGVELS